MINEASRAGAILTRAKELFAEDPEVYEALKDWFEFREGRLIPEYLIHKLNILAERAQNKAETSIDQDDRFNDPND